MNSFHWVLLGVGIGWVSAAGLFYWFLKGIDQTIRLPW